ncbi:hypothetical protein PSHT_14346 [Puccinia striiformis]|uniref:Uncharacterized protein n=1 Tax=Puccinia striiformis TaxID=27350 RepID=A0A2S4UKL5_9BASI|nr:hypothetical protein PSHT_14346 [Puccinia striiformis]
MLSKAPILLKLLASLAADDLAKLCAAHMDPDCAGSGKLALLITVHTRQLVSVEADLPIIDLKSRYDYLQNRKQRWKLRRKRW